MFEFSRQRWTACHVSAPGTSRRGLGLQCFPAGSAEVDSERFLLTVWESGWFFLLLVLGLTASYSHLRSLLKQRWLCRVWKTHLLHHTQKEKLKRIEG